MTVCCELHFCSLQCLGIIVQMYWFQWLGCIIASEEMGPVILCALITHTTLTAGLYRGAAWKASGFLEHLCLLFWMFMPHPRKMKFLIKKWGWPPFLETACNTGLYPSPHENAFVYFCICMGIVVHVYCQVNWDCCHSIWRANRYNNFFLGMHQCCLISLQ